MNKKILYFCLIVSLFLFQSCFESSVEKGKKAFEAGDYNLAVQEWDNVSTWLISQTTDKWNYSIALEKVGRDEDAFSCKVSIYNSLINDEYMQERVNRADSKIFNDILEWGKEAYKKQQAEQQVNKHKEWMKENHFMELSKIEKGVYYMMEVGEHQDAKTTLGYIPEYRLFPKGELKEVINDEVKGVYSWNKESDTHVTFYNYNAWTDTMINGDLYLNDDDSLSMYVEGDYVGKLYMRYRVKE